MRILFYSTAAITLAAALSFTASSQSAGTKPGNCAIYAQMSAETVKEDSRFDDHKDIALSLMKFADAQNAKLDASMAQTYKASKAYGWDKAKVDEMMEQTNAAMRKSFFTPTMDQNKLYMDHVQAVHACATAQNTPADLGQSADAMLATLKKMAEIVVN